MILWQIFSELVFNFFRTSISLTMKKDKNSSLNIALKLQRKLAIQAGYYDGRFKEKTVKDKKKEDSKRKARKKVRIEKELD